MSHWSGSDILDTSSSLDAPLSARQSSGQLSARIGGVRSTKSRRGGFGDAGTMGSNGELPEAPTIPVTSDRQLADEINGLVDGLEPSVDWVQRVKTMLRFEGLMKGGAVDMPNFGELLNAMQIPLSAQLQDRRSAISRQALHLITIILQAYGPRAEPFAAALQPVIFKALGMSIQIVTDASNACSRTLIQCCPSPRLLPLLCITVQTSKAVKMRVAAAELLLLALREWDASMLEPQADRLEPTIISAARDASGETREAGRAAFVAYQAKFPAAAIGMLRRLPDTERSLKEKLQAAVNRAIAGPSDAVVTLTTRTSSFSPSQKSSGDAPVDRRAVRVPRLAIPAPHTTAVKQDFSGFLSARGGPSGSFTAPTPPPLSPAAPVVGQKHEYNSSGEESQLPASDEDSGEEGKEETVFKVESSRPSMATGAVRVPRLSIDVGEPAHPQHIEGKHVPKSARMCLPDANAFSSLRQPMEIEEPRDGMTSFKDAVEKFKRRGLSWSEKMNLYEAIYYAIEEKPLPMDGPNENYIEGVVRLFLDGVNDAHFKVCTSALRALISAMSCPLFTPAIETLVETIMSSLFTRVTDVKEQVRHLAGMAASLLPQTLDPDTVTHGLAASLHCSKSPKVLCAVMDYFVELIAVGMKEGWDPTNSGAARAMLAGCLTLAVNKRPAVRQSALAAVAAVHGSNKTGPSVVQSAIEIMPPSAATSIRRGIQQVKDNAATPQKSAAPGFKPIPSPSPSPSPRPRGSASSSPTKRPPQSPSKLPGLPLPMDIDTSPTKHSQQSSPSKAMQSPYSARGLRSPTTPLSARIGSNLPSPIARSMPTDIDEAKEAMLNSSYAIKADATFNIQMAPAPPKWDTAPSVWPPAPLLTFDEVQCIVESLQPIATMDAMSEALGAAARVEGENLEVLTEGVQKALAEVLESDLNPELMELSLRVFGEIASKLPTEELELAVTALLRDIILAEGHEHPGVAFAAQNCAQQLVGRLPAVTGISMLIPMLPRSDKRPPFEGERAILALGALRLLRLLFPNLTDAEMNAALGTMTPPMCVCYTSANAELRRSAVDCLVALHLRLGEPTMAPHVSVLSSAQMKLIQVYMERAAKAY